MISILGLGYEFGYFFSPMILISPITLNKLYYPKRGYDYLLIHLLYDLWTSSLVYYLLRKDHSLKCWNIFRAVSAFIKSSLDFCLFFSKNEFWGNLAAPTVLDIWLLWVFQKPNDKFLNHWISCIWYILCCWINPLTWPNTWLNHQSGSMRE